MTLSGNPYCSTSSASTGGTIVGTSGTVTLMFSSSYGSTNSYSVSQHPRSRSASRPPRPLEYLALGRAAWRRLLRRRSQIRLGPGSVCKLDYSVESCNSSSKGEVTFIAAGWVWFNYNKKTKRHYKWAINLAEYTAESQRSSYTEFTGTIDAHSTSNYHGECT